MNVTMKAVADIQPGVDDASSPNGTFDVILSAQTLDRDGDTLAKDEWKLPLPDKINFDTDHGMSVATTIGSGSPFINDNGDLQVTGTYSSLKAAQDVRTLVSEGHIWQTSVAFITEKASKSANGRVQRELLNGSFVAIPANKDAVVLASKSGARNNASDAQKIQAIHDVASNLGASCASQADDTGDDEGENSKSCLVVRNGVVGLKAISGSIQDLQNRLADELGEKYPDPDQYVWIRAVFLDSLNSGTVVYSIGDSDDPSSRTFTDDGKSATLGDEVSDVSIITSIVLEDDNDADTSSKSIDTTAVDSAAAAANAAAAEDAAAVEMTLRAKALELSAHLLSM